MGISQPEGSDEEQFTWLLNNITVYKIQFFFAFLISPSLIYLMLSQLEKYPLTDKITYRTGILFISGYLVLNSIAYASQMIILPKLIEAELTEQAKVWYFGSSTSVIYFINQMGYCFWAVGTILLFARLIREKGIIKYLSIIYLISAILSIIAFVGLIIERKVLNSMTIYSGLVLLPVGIMTAIWGIKEIK